MSDELDKPAMEPWTTERLRNLLHSRIEDAQRLADRDAGPNTMSLFAGHDCNLVDEALAELDKLRADNEVLLSYNWELCAENERLRKKLYVVVERCSLLRHKDGIDGEVARLVLSLLGAAQGEEQQ